MGEGLGRGEGIPAGGEGSQAGGEIVVRPFRPDRYHPQSTDRSTHDPLSNSDEMEVNASDEIETMHFIRRKLVCKIPLVSTKTLLPRNPETKADLLPSREGKRVTFCTSGPGLP